jgi:thiamine biosynthesis lipoprotein
MDAARGRWGARGWRLIDIGTAAVAVAERDALGSTARVAAWPPYRLPGVLIAVNEELALLDEQASRFRDDSEISLVQRCLAGAGPSGSAGPGSMPLRGSRVVSEGLAEAIAVALAAAEWTGGLVDPTVGTALAGLGYDRDFAALSQVTDGEAAPPRPAQVPGWRSVRLDGRRLHMTAGVRLDLGATAKGLGSDRAARVAAACVPGGGVLVSLGGDIAVAGEAPAGGWPVLVADEPRPAAGPEAAGPERAGPAHAQAGHPVAAAGGQPGQLIRLAAGGLATSSILCRQWRRGGYAMHHIVDPRTGMPAAGPWRTASVAASTCAEANAAATAAIVAGEQAVPWLAAQGLPARLVGRDGGVRLAGGWPAEAGGLIDAPAARRMPSGPTSRPASGGLRPPAGPATGTAWPRGAG